MSGKKFWKFTRTLYILLLIPTEKITKLLLDVVIIQVDNDMIFIELTVFTLIFNFVCV